MMKMQLYVCKVAILSLGSLKVYWLYALFGVRVGVTEEGHFRYGVFWDYFPDIDVAGLGLVFLHYF